MADIYIDLDDDATTIVVTVCRGVSEPRKRRFIDRAAAEQFAADQLGRKRGMICSTLDMTAEQRAAFHARTAGR